MNDKEKMLMQIVDIVVECCATQVNESGRMSVTKEDVLGTSRAENVVMTRCILAMMVVGAGYSVTTTAMLMNRSVHAVRHMVEVGQQYHMSSRAFRIAFAEATLKCKDMDGSGM